MLQPLTAQELSELRTEITKLFEGHDFTLAAIEHEAHFLAAYPLTPERYYFVAAQLSAAPDWGGK
jgi:4'-phosphopantetheinyl transferase EntD